MIQENVPMHYQLNQNRYSTQKDIILLDEQTENRQYFTGIHLALNNNNEQVFIAELISQLKKETKNLNRAILFIFINGNYQIIGADPLPKDKTLDYKQIADQSVLYIIYRSPVSHKRKTKTIINQVEQQPYQLQIQQAQSQFLQSLTEQKIKIEENNDDKSNNNNLIPLFEKTEAISEEDIEEDQELSCKKREKRVKERKISYVVDKVVQWRKLYEQGYENNKGQHVKVNLDISAQLVGLSRKTLDDYYSQIKKGEQMGFDFVQNTQAKMGVLRKFVKDSNIETDHLKPQSKDNTIQESTEQKTKKSNEKSSSKDQEANIQNNNNKKNQINNKYPNIINNKLQANSIIQVNNSSFFTPIKSKSKEIDKINIEEENQENDLQKGNSDTDIKQLSIQIQNTQIVKITEQEQLQSNKSMEEENDINNIGIGENTEEQEILEDFNVWKKNTPYLYDLMIQHQLQWPSLTVEWLPQKTSPQNSDYSIQKLIIGTHAEENEKNYLIIAKIRLPLLVQESYESEDQGNRLVGENNAKDIDLDIQILHDGDVNRARYMPQRQNVIASKTVSGKIHIFDYYQSHIGNQRSTQNEAQPQIILNGHDKEGYGLSWNSKNEGHLISAGYDGKICYWDICKAANINQSLDPLQFNTFHQCDVEDVCWHVFDSNIFGSVSSDQCAALWDVRQNIQQPFFNFQAHEGQIHSIDFNPFNEYLFLTCSEDKKIKVWDMRNLSSPLICLQHHQDSVLKSQWSPFNVGVIASCSEDRTVNVWDLSRENHQKAQDNQNNDCESEQLIFQHGGHCGQVNDISWNTQDPLVMASVDDDNRLHIWQMASKYYEVDEDFKKY